jgi:cell division protein FtsQ
MKETVTLQREKFFRPREKRVERGGERFQAILKKAIRTAFQLLLVSFSLFIGHWVYIHLLEDPFFRVREVEVEGCRRIARETILSLTRLEGMPNLFTVSLREVAKPLESHPWIDHVGVRKIFPNKILVQVEERKPIAILQLEELYYIDTKGVIFSPVGDRDGHDYPFLTGLTRQLLERDPVEAKGLIMKGLELLRIAEKEKGSPLQDISEIHMEKNYGIKCFTRAEGIEVRIGSEYFEEKLKRLSPIWADLQKRGFSAASIDCSDLKRMVVKRVPRSIDLERR